MAYEESIKDINTKALNWNLNDIYPSVEAFDADVEKLKNEYTGAVEFFEGKLSNPQTIFDCMSALETLTRTLDKLSVYTFLKSSLDQADSKATEEVSKIDALCANIAQKISFIEPEILSLPLEKLIDLSNHPTLKNYKFFFDVLIKEKPHILTKDEEKLMAALSDALGASEQIYEKLAVADADFPKIADSDGKLIELSEPVYQKIMLHPDREYRQRAFEGIHSFYTNHKNSFSQTLSYAVKTSYVRSRIRKYPSNLEKALDSENVPVEVFNNLISAVNDNLGALHKYVDIKKSVLGTENVCPYDLSVPLIQPENSEIPFKECSQMVVEALKPLGQEYLETYERAYKESWIDAYEKPHKAKGGYNCSIYDTHPFILMNYNDTIQSAFTFIHEIGHAINSVYSNSTQPYQYHRTPIFTAEVASTANEILLQNYLIDNAKNDDEKLYYLNKVLEGIRTTFFMQVMYSEFESNVHQRIESGDAVSPDYLNSLWGALLEKYHGRNYQVGELAPVGWARIPHFYRPFYVYKYATSLAASNELMKKISLGSEDEKNVARERYIEFLKGGSHDYPINILKKAGVDMTAAYPINNLIKDFSEKLNQLEKILKRKGKIK